MTVHRLHEDDRVRCYIAGPMRGIEHYNFPAFDEARATLEELGYVVSSPAAADRELGFDETSTDPLPDGFMAAAMERDLRAVLDVDVIVLLPGWEGSSGVAEELHLARLIGRAVVEYETLMPPPDVRAVETRIVDPKTGGAKGSKLARHDLIPVAALTALAEHFGRGTQKYEDRNWERGYRWGLSYAALCRHLFAWWAGEDLDSETGSSHLTAVAWHAMALYEFQRRGSGTDDRVVDGSG